MPQNLAVLFTHIMSKASEGTHGSPAVCSWEEVLQLPAGGDPPPFPMSAQDWRKVEAFSSLLQHLIDARHALSPPTKACNGKSEKSAISPATSDAAASATPRAPAARSSVSDTPQANSGSTGIGKLLPAHETPGGYSLGTATPAPGSAMPVQSMPRVTPKETSRAGEPSAPMKPVGRVAASRRGNGGAEGAVASLATTKSGPGAFETPCHSNHTTSPRDAESVSARGRDHSPSRYPARLRSRRFPQLSGGGYSPEQHPVPSESGHHADSDAQSPRSPSATASRAVLNNHTPYLPGAVSDSPGASFGRADDEGVSGMTSRTAPHSPQESLGKASASHANTNTPAAAVQKSTAVQDPSKAATLAANGTPSNAVLETGQRLRTTGSGGRSGSRAPLLRSSVGGRNYTDHQVKQLVLIEQAVIANATPEDQATYNLPRQGRTLTLTNIFKFVALHGANTMYNLATSMQVESHTGRHSNFFDGKIDARIVSVIRKDIGDEAITKSRKFSKILLSLVAEGAAVALARILQCILGLKSCAFVVVFLAKCINLTAAKCRIWSRVSA